MLKKTITFEDLDGNKITEDFWFHLSKADLAEMLMVGGDDFEKNLHKIVDSGNGQLIMDTFKDLIGRSVGRRSENNRSFVKTKEIRDEFMGSDAYSVLFLELVTTANAAAEFIRGVVPSDMAKEAEAKVVELSDKRPANVQPTPFPQSLQTAVEGVSNDAQAQADKPQPDTLPTALFSTTQQLRPDESPISAEPAKDDEDPAWLTEGRKPTRQELMKMSKEDMQFVFKMTEAGLIK